MLGGIAQLRGKGDALLVIEVCDTTARFDREIKLPLYARHGVREVWLADLASRSVEVCREPRAETGDYTLRQRHDQGWIAVAALPDCRVDVGTLFPPAATAE